MDWFTYITLAVLFGALLCAAYSPKKRPFIEGVYKP